MENSNTENKKKKWERPPRYMGVIRSFNLQRGFGFVQCYDDGESYFCHISQFKDDVPERGMVIEFAIYENPKTGKKCCSNCLVVEVPEKRRNRY